MSASLFDLDHTLLRVNCSYRFGAYLYKQRFFSFFTMFFLVILYASHKAGFLSLSGLHQKNFDLIFRGRNFASIEQSIEAFLDKELDDSLYPPAIERLQNALKNGHRTVLLSSSPDFLVRSIAKRLNIPEWHATVYALDREGKFSSIPFVLQGNDKAAYAHSIQEHVTAYSDSELDLPFLEAANVAVAVNPSKKLLRYVELHQWEII